MELYEQIVEGVLHEASVGASTLTSVVGAVSASPRGPDRSELDRIARERDRALARYVQGRDADALERTMAQLDREEKTAREPRPADGVPAEVAVRYLRELPETWRRAEGGRGRQRLAGALFQRIDVLGLQEATVYLTAEAERHGFAAALPEKVGISVSGRGERASPSLTQQSLRFVMINRTPRESLPTAAARSA